MSFVKKLITIISLTSFVIFASCGTLFIKPHASFTNHSDNLDYKVVFLDSLGLIFLIVPGVIALTVDYITGTIYLTDEENAKKSKGVDPKDVRDLIAQKNPSLTEKQLNEITEKVVRLQHNNN